MKNEFPYEKIYWQQFEDVVIKICRQILGIAAKKFSDGVDGGRDSTFEGRADHYPSNSKPWNGKFIIQAKHTSSPIASCSDSDFSGDGKNSIISIELVRLKKLMDKDPFDNYLLFSNRKLPANKHTEIKNRIKAELGIENVAIIGNEEINSHVTYKIAEEFGLLQYILPFRIYEKDIQDVIILFHEQNDNIMIDDEQININLNYLDIKKKNELNNLNKQYFDWIKSHSLQHFSKIESFLKDPRNRQYATYYENTVSDLQGTILAKRSEFAKFDLILEYIFKLILESDFDKLKDHRRMIRVFLHFMYFNCDIGVKE
ncbi:MAG: ABC-three component system protein [bacterium]